MSLAPSISASCAACCGSAGSWAGAVAARTWRLTYSDGRSLTHGHLAPDRLPVLVEAPQQRRQPREAGLEQDDAQRRDALEDALGDEAEQLRLGDDLRVAQVVLEVGVGEAARGRRAARPGPRRGGRARGPWRRSPGGGRGSGGCPSASRCGSGRARRRSRRGRAEALDLLDRQVGVERGDRQVRAQALVALEPLGAQPVVDRAAQRGLVVAVAAGVERGQAGEDGVAQPPRFEHLLAQGVDVARRRRRRSAGSCR